MSLITRVTALITAIAADVKVLTETKNSLGTAATKDVGTSLGDVLAVDEDTILTKSRYAKKTRITTSYKSVTQKGWYTIAVCAGSSAGYGQRAFAEFLIADSASGRHQSIKFVAGMTYGKTPFVNVLGHSTYTSTLGITNIRLLDGGTYDGCLLQVYVSNPPLNLAPIIMENNIALQGFELANYLLAGSDEETQFLANKVDKSKLKTAVVAPLSTLYSMSISSGIACTNLYFNNGALVSSRIGSSNIDHIWHDDGANIWHFCSDSAYKAEGNATVKVGAIIAGAASYKKGWRRLTATLPTGAGEITVAHGVTKMGARSAVCIASDGVEVSNNDPSPDYQFYLRRIGANLAIGKSASTPKLDGKEVTIFIEEQL